MGLGQCILNTVLLDLRQLCEIDEKQYNMGPLKYKQKRKVRTKTKHDLPLQIKKDISFSFFFVLTNVRVIVTTPA